eukprot:1179077-Prorocentrum_minimum.AAC.5
MSNNTHHGSRRAFYDTAHRRLPRARQQMPRAGALIIKGPTGSALFHPDFTPFIALLNDATLLALIPPPLALNAPCLLIGASDSSVRGGRADRRAANAPPPLRGPWGGGGGRADQQPPGGGANRGAPPGGWNHTGGKAFAGGHPRCGHKGLVCKPAGGH